jgi:hypothetical protein
VDLDFDRQDLLILYVVTAFMSLLFITAIVVLLRIALFFLNAILLMGFPVTLGYLNLPLYSSTYRELSLYSW